MPTDNNKKTISPRVIVLALVVCALGVVALSAPLAMPSSEGQTAAAPAADPFASVEVGGKAAIVLDVRSGEVLYEKNPGVQLPLASLTKVMLALVAAEALPLDSTMTIPYYAAGSNGQNLLEGERWSVKDVIAFTLVTSSNSGAQILADAANERIRARFPDAPEKGAALWRMNMLAKEMGLGETFYLNAHGLDLSTTQAGAYGSVRDMARLFAYAASAEPALFSNTAHGEIFLASSDPSTGSKTVHNTNVAQGLLPGLIMGKTGLTDLAGGNLGVVFDAGLSQPVVAIVLGSTEEGRFDDIQKLVSTARMSFASR